MAIAFIGNNTAGSGGTATITLPFGARAGGELHEVDVCIDSGSVTVSSVTDTPGSTYTFRGAILSNATRTEKWSTSATGSLAGGAVDITVNLSGAAAARAAGTIRSGVVALGPVTSASGTTANPTIDVTTQDSNNWVSVAFGGLTNTAFTANVGNLRASAADGNAGVANNDNTSASPGTVTNTVTKVATDWGAVAMELRTSDGSTVYRSISTMRVPNLIM